MTEDRERGEDIEVVGEHAGSYEALLYRNVMILGWHGNATVAAAQNFGTLAGAVLARGQHAQISSVHCIARTVQIPDAQTRAALLKVGEEFREQTACVAAIIVGSGFWASAMRGVVTGLRVVAPRTLEMRAFGHVEEVIEWLPAEHARRTGITLDGATLRAALERATEHAPHEAPR